MSNLNEDIQKIQGTDQLPQQSFVDPLQTSIISGNKRQHSNSYIDNGGAKRTVIESPATTQNASPVDPPLMFTGNSPRSKQFYKVSRPSSTAPASPKKFTTFNNPNYQPSVLPQKEFKIPQIVGTPQPLQHVTQQAPQEAAPEQSQLPPQVSQIVPSQQPAPEQPPQSRLSTDEQVLINKLQDSYKVIITLESDLQKKCASLNLPNRLDMTELWDIYNLNIHLLNSYYDFLIYSLNSGKSGKQIVQIYRIQRRLWVYGIVTFLDVLKNVVSIFIEHDICSSFIAYSFNILTGLTELTIDSWIFEKIGDLSRMAIALYPSRHIDWKLSSEYWYTLAMKLNYGQGKVYYHIATVQQDNLDALMNIGKAVFCKETFVPTQQYMKMVIDNINQRQYVDLPVMDFIRIHKILLVQEISGEELDKLINFYCLSLGKDTKNTNFFYEKERVEDMETKLQFWFQRSSSFALVNILQICGFGNTETPFAKLFGLIDALQERRDRREKKDKRPKQVEVRAATDVWTSEQWFSKLENLNPHVLQLSMKMFQSFLKGPTETALPHTITYLYFLVSLGEAIKHQPEAKDFIELFVQLIFPLDSLVDFLNLLLQQTQKVHHHEESFWDSFSYEDDFYNTDEWLEYFNNNESLHEVWKCWGTLWFDKIYNKTEYDDYRSAGLVRDDFLDVPVSGIRYDPNGKNPRILRVLLLACYISSHFNFGLKRDENTFKIQTTSTSHSHYQSFFNKFSLYGIINEVSDTNTLTSASSTIPISTWLKQPSTQNSNIPLSPTGSTTYYYTDNEADYENSSASTPSIPASVQQNTSIVMSQHRATINSDTLFILDTNMWLKHCGKLFKSLRSRIFNLGIPLVIFQELRSLRCSPDATVAESATRCVITLRQLTAEGLVHPMKMNGEFITNINDIKDFENNGGWMNGIDDIIINSAVLRRDCYLITEDKNMKLKAKTRNINAFNGDWFWNVVGKLSHGKCNN